MESQTSESQTSESQTSESQTSQAGQSVGMERQLDIFMRGMQGQTPERPIAPEHLREAAREAMTPEAFGYLAGGAGAEDTMRENRAAFRRWRIRPRLMRDVDGRDLTATLFAGTPREQRLRAPLLLAPVGVQSIIHERGEKAVARAAARTNTPFALSTVSSFTMEEVAEAHDEALAEAGGGEGTGSARWFQLYWPKDFDVAASFVERAEEAGYSALVVTLDTYLLAWRDRDLEHGYLPFLYQDGLANYFTDPVFRAALDEPPEENPTQAVFYFASLFSNPGLTWDDLAWLRDQTDLPIILKGLLHPEDVRRGIERGADAVVVSNHGGRQMDGAVASLDALPAAVEAADGEADILFDSGIRRAADVFKAVALGAEAVLLGRPYCYGLGAGGQAGVEDVIENLVAELDLTLGLSGCRSFEDVDREALVRSGPGRAVGGGRS